LLEITGWLVKYWEIIADRLSKARWSLGSGLDLLRNELLKQEQRHDLAWSCSSRPRLCGGCCSGGGSMSYLLGRRARLLLLQCFALFRVIPDQVRNVRAWLGDFVLQHAPQNVAPYRTRHRNTNRNCRHLISGQAVFQVFFDLFLSHNTFLLQYSTASDQASFVQNLPKCSLS
jgi:hypothetical protein